MLKKLLCVMTCVVMVFALAFAGCTENPDDAGTPDVLPDVPAGNKQLVIYYNRDKGYDDCDVWMWYGDVSGRGYTFETCGYGARVVLNVPETVTEVGFIIRTECSEPGGTEWGSAIKDGTENDRSVALTEKRTVIYTKSGDAMSYTSDDGGKTLNIVRKIDSANIEDLKNIRIYFSDSKYRLKKEDVTVTADGTAVSVESVSNNTLHFANDIDISKKYEITVKDFATVTALPINYLASKSFSDAYTYDGELGVILTANSTTFKLWAPTASSVKLNLYDAGTGGTATTKDLTKGEKGVWSLTENSNLNGKYYTYTVKTMVGSNEVVDPYAKSAGLNGNRGMIIDLESTNPEGWVKTPFDNPAVENYTDAQIWEVHVRDFSNKIEGSQYKGKFLAFTETGLKNTAGQPVGVDYLKELGITHVHLLPSFDYASVDESKSNEFNWGYDPKNYNVPEGSYSTDPADGAKRVKEFKQMVQALHNNGISVIMDVVYNHTYEGESNFHKIVPYYYYRFDTMSGVNMNGSGCGNETASERSMVRKFMVDSVSYWQKEYNVDGFRFDLMGLHDITTMQEIEKAVHAHNSEAIIYGEGWQGGTSGLANNKASLLANLKTLNKGTSTGGVNGVAMFNDVIRDAIKGSVFDMKDTGFATGANHDYANKILFGAKGSVASPTGTTFGGGSSWTAPNPTAVINYASAHDNNTLWDRICITYGEEASTLEDRIRRNNLSAAIVQTSLGIPFMQAGEEMLRDKKKPDGGYDENSYKSSDSINNLKWESLTTDSAQLRTFNYYKGLIAFRKSCATLRLPSALDSEGKLILELVKSDGALLAFTVTNPTTAEKLLIVYNANKTDKELALPEGSWNLYVNATEAGTEVISSHTGTYTASKISCSVFKKA